MYPGRLHPSRMCETQVGPPTLDVKINSVRLNILLSATCYHDALVVRHQKEQMCTLYKSVCLVGHSSWTTLCMNISSRRIILTSSIRWTQWVDPQPIRVQWQQIQSGHQHRSPTDENPSSRKSEEPLSLKLRLAGFFLSEEYSSDQFTIVLIVARFYQH